jgi:hypothetical protein
MIKEPNTGKSVIYKHAILASGRFAFLKKSIVSALRVIYDPLRVIYDPARKLTPRDSRIYVLNN